MTYADCLMGNSIESTDARVPAELVTYKMSWHTQMHTARYPWLMSIQAENFIEMNPVDATARRLRTGDWARLTSATSPEELKGWCGHRHDCA